MGYIKKKMVDLERYSLEEVALQPKIGVSLLLDNIRSAHNVGAFFRTADAFAIKKIYLYGITPSPPHPAVLKTALGATESIPWQVISEKEYTLFNSFEKILIEQVYGAQCLSTFEPNPKKEYLLIFGHEVTGISDFWLQNSQHCLEVPQYGHKHSLNVSVCGGVVLWHFFKAMYPFDGGR